MPPPTPRHTSSRHTKHSFQGFDVYPYILHDYLLLAERNMRRFMMDIDPDLSWVPDFWSWFTRFLEW